MAYLVLVVLQVRVVFPGVTQDDNSEDQVYQWLTRGIVTVEVSGLVLSPWSERRLGSWGLSLRQLLVEGHNLSHSLGVRVRAQVLYS